MKGRGCAAGLLACTLTLAACGGGGSGGRSSTTQISGAKVLDANAPVKPGVIKFCSGKDTPGVAHDVVVRFNKRYASQGLTAKLVEFSPSADEQRNQFVQREQAKSGDCDVFSSDVVWTAEFASQKWLYDLTPYVQKRRADFIPATLNTIHYAGKYWGVPLYSDAAFLYYNSSRVPQAPATWQDVYRLAKSDGGIVYQGNAYEGLTCDFLEYSAAAGGKVLSPDGTKAVIDSPQNLKALELMVDGVRSGAAPHAVVTYTEEEARNAFESGKYAFMRNWTYAYALGQRAGSKVRNRLGVAPLPAWRGARAAATLGGHNLVISAFSNNPGGALKLIDFMTSPAMEMVATARFSMASPLAATYGEPAVKKALPYAAELRTTIENGVSRPVSPVYPQISQAIYKNVNAALAGQLSPQAALKNADAQINKALRTF